MQLDVVDLRPGSMLRGVLAITLSLVACLVLFGHNYLWLWPNVGKDGFDGWSAMEDVDPPRIVGVAVGWIVASSVIALFEIIRLRARERWALDYPGSWWRVGKSAALVFGWTAAFSLVVNLAVASSLDRVGLGGEGGDLGYDLALLVLGSLALLVGLVMTGVDASRSSRKMG